MLTPEKESRHHKRSPQYSIHFSSVGLNFGHSPVSEIPLQPHISHADIRQWHAMEKYGTKTRPSRCNALKM